LDNILPRERRCLNCKKRFPVFEHCEKRQFCTRQCSRDYERVDTLPAGHKAPPCTPEMADKIVRLLTREMPNAHLMRALRKNK
jgi:hypothetical protein